MVGVLAALLEAQKSGQGQVVDVAMCDGAASLMSLFCELTAIGRWKDGRECNLLDGGAHFYGTYECKDGEFISLGSIEPQFYAELRRLAGLDDALYDGQMDAKKWPAMKAKITEVFKSKTRAEWCAMMEGATSASRRCCRCRRRPNIRTWRSAGFSSMSTAWCSPPGAALFADAVGDQEDGGGGAG